MSKSKLTIPCQWDINVIKKILTFTAKKDIEIVEMYGALSNGKLPQGREKSIAHHTTREEARKIKLFLESQKIQFAYLINTPINMQMYDELEEELEWIINVFKADSLTISYMNFSTLYVLLFIFVEITLIPFSSKVAIHFSVFFVITKIAGPTEDIANIST